MIFVAKDKNGMPFGYYQANTVKEVREYLDNSFVFNYEISVVEICDLVERKKIMGKNYWHTGQRVRLRDAIRMFRSKVDKL
jgi:hypothetical protein